MAAAQRVALVTGASTGLGRACAQQLASAGFVTYGGVRNLAKVQAELTAEPPPAAFVPVALDVTSDDSVAEAVKMVLGAHGRLDVLVNNAGALVVGTVEMVSVDQAKAMFEVNVFGAIRCMHHALAAMRAQKAGCIVNISSVFSEIPTMNQPVYAATKAALDAMTLGTRGAVEPFGITIHTVQSGGIKDTNIAANLQNGDRFAGAQNPYPIDEMVKDSVFDRVFPHAQTSAAVAAVVVDIATGKETATLVQPSEYTAGLVESKLKDPSGAAMVALRY